MIYLSEELFMFYVVLPQDSLAWSFCHIDFIYLFIFFDL